MGYSYEQRRNTIKLAKQNNIRSASNKTGIPLGTVKRWVYEDKKKCNNFCSDCIHNPENCKQNLAECKQDPLARHYFEQYETTYGILAR